MAYFVYSITPGPTQLIKNLELLQEFDEYKPAQQFAKAIRAEQAAGESHTIKVIFAQSSLEAEERLQEHREAPILREWEK